MVKQASYEAVVVYASEPISLLDRNLVRIANNYDGSMCGDSFEYSEVRQRRRLAYGFEAKGKRNRFIAAVRKFLRTADFGISITVE